MPILHSWSLKVIILNHLAIERISGSFLLRGCEESLYLGSLLSQRRVNLLVLLRPSPVLTWGWETEVSGRARFILPYVTEPPVRHLTPTSGRF